MPGRHILFIGPAGDGGSLYHGASVKNRLIMDRLSGEGYDVAVVDTEHWRQSPSVTLKLAARILHQVLSRHYDDIIVSASRMSAYRIIHILCSLLRNTPVHYWVIGGAVEKEIETGKFSVRVLHRLSTIIVESALMCDKLKGYGLRNVVHIPNFRPLPTANPHSSLLSDMECVTKFVFISRIDPAKGVSLIFEADRLLRQKYGEGRYRIDFYGMIAPGFENEFRSLLSSSPACSHNGLLELPDPDAFARLSSYDALLFPTMWESEGMAGIIIESFMAGVPVIASDWNYNREFVKDGVTGFVIRPGSASMLAGAMEKFLIHDPVTVGMRNECFTEGRRYDIRKVLDTGTLNFLFKRN